MSEREFCVNFLSLSLYAKVRQKHLDFHISLDCELLVGEIEALGFLLSDLDHADDATRAAIAVGCQRNHILQEVLGLLEGEVVPVELVEVAPDESGA